ncbi:MAG TPA: DUF2127 domain-containing protein [Sphingomicrobium sp.]|nr:DUF2127 domain-containing protein [Sphingomicrobium sp.]
MRRRTPVDRDSDQIGFACVQVKAAALLLPMQEKRIHQVFAISVSLKGLHAIMEMVGGMALYLTSAATILDWIDRFTADEISRDPNDWIATHLIKFGQTFSVAEHDFFAFYLLSHGIVKIVLVYGLLKEKMWAYPASFVVFGAFIAYQLYRYSFTHELALILLSIFDIFVIALAVHEYRLLRHHLPTH